MEKLEFSRVGERMYHEKLANGLNVFVFPKPEFQKGYAFFATNYGGMDMKFCLDGQRGLPQRLYQLRHHGLLLRVHGEI